MKWGLLITVLAAGALWLAYSGNNREHEPQGIDAFVERHWNKPLQAQGAPPEHFSPREASLAPQSCAECHAEQHRDWSGSLHSQTMDNGILWQARVLPPKQVKRCLDCHAPLAEQKALLAQTLGWPEAPQEPPPEYVSPDLHRQGLVCAACHVRAHRRFGPPPAPGNPAGDTPGLPHDGFVESAAFGDSRFCASCHQFPEDGPALNDKLLENTLNEWKASRHAKEGRHCQTCHMPDRKHVWKGIHDPGMVRQALSTNIEIGESKDGDRQVQASIRNTGAGHYFPTYLVPRVRLQLIAMEGEAGERIVLDEAVISRETDVWLSEEFSDTRLAPDAERVLAGVLPGESEAEWTLYVQMDVAPKEHYERMFAGVLADTDVELDSETRNILEAALVDARRTRYSMRLAERSLPGGIAN
ncbi:multiheme c-type cytochrome [Thiohalobacter thiocyanaticus]|uniref:multiheme c-type cytochrome n=1 Tax=Thiohalobacter thiocyanaticus TaxID=585455 RepID=UPI00131A382D|nr:multiheme c-type cytochrome [Thiohalobacter thiocyanaticus]